MPYIPLTDTDPTVILVVADILGGVVATVGTVEVMVVVMLVALAEAGMVGTAAVMVVAAPMDGEEDMAATDA